MLKNVVAYIHNKAEVCIWLAATHSFKIWHNWTELIYMALKLYKWTELI